jgi:hypothetical protein
MLIGQLPDVIAATGLKKESPHPARAGLIISLCDFLSLCQYLNTMVSEGGTRKRFRRLRECRPLVNGNPLGQGKKRC